MRWAILRAGIVETVARWDGVSPWAASANAVRIPDDVPAGPGWAYDGSTWTDARPIPPEPTERDLVLALPVDLPEQIDEDPVDPRHAALRLLLVVHAWLRAALDSGDVTARKGLLLLRLARLHLRGDPSPRLSLTAVERATVAAFVSWWQS
jgi:hypothetical protein